MESTINLVSQFISNVGFPAVAYFGLLYMYNKTITEQTKQMSTLQSIITELKDSVEDLKDAIMGRGDD